MNCTYCGKSSYRYEGNYQICKECGRMYMKTCEDCGEETKILYHGKCMKCYGGIDNCA